MKLLLKEQEFKKSWKCRNIYETYTLSLGRLILESHRDAIDYQEETQEDGIKDPMDMSKVWKAVCESQPMAFV
jgi:hypothetical protein